MSGPLRRPDNFQNNWEPSALCGARCQAGGTTDRRSWVLRSCHPRPGNGTSVVRSSPASGLQGTDAAWPGRTG